MNRAYILRLHPNAEQLVILEKHFGCVRKVYNHCLALQIEQLLASSEDKSLTMLHGWRQLQDGIVALKHTDDYNYLCEVNSQSLLATLQNLKKGFTNFFREKAKHNLKHKPKTIAKIKERMGDRFHPLMVYKGFPTFKRKHHKQSFACPQHVTLDQDKGVITLPKVKGGIKAVFTREVVGKVKTVTITKTPTGKYYASVLVDNDDVIPTPTTIEPSQTLGIDLGLSHLLITSDGQKVDNPRFLTKSLTRLGVAQKKLSRKAKGSNNSERQRIVVAQCHEGIANQRLDAHHQLTHRLVSENQATTFAVEDLGIKNMVKNKKLARAINDVGWGQFIRLLTYKALWWGKNVIKVNRFYPSSKTCAGCGSKIDKLPLSVRSWQCQHCHTTHDRDINAATNIRHQALADALGLSAV